jgi:pyruvate dehydrogenase E2 component (dihydrolipoamide acetyltransferase)
MDALLKSRRVLNAALGSDRIGAHELLLKAAALAMKAVPDVNASWLETKVRVFHRCDINVVVGIGDGMAAPVILDVGAKGLVAIAEEVRPHPTLQTQAAAQLVVCLCR